MSYIGMREPVHDAFEKVTGKMKYTDDIDVPHCLVGKILFSPIPHGKIKEIDVSVAKNMKGVHAVITYKDVPDIKFNRLMRVFEDDAPAFEKVLEDELFWHGDKIAAVAAETEGIALAALKSIKLELEELPHETSSLKAYENNFQLHNEEANLAPLIKKVGNVAVGFQEADYIIEHSMSTHALHHGAIEPYVVIADWQNPDLLKIIGPQQGVYSAQIMLAKIFNLKFNQIRVINPVIGGTFGGKEGMLFEPLAALLSRHAERPVKIRLNRKESIIGTHTRHRMDLKAKLGISKEGEFIALSIENILDVGPHCGPSLYVQNAMAGKLFKVYKIPHIYFKSTPVYTNGIVGGAMRGYGSPQLFAMLETLVEKACQKLGLDSYDVRLKNAINPYDLDPTSQLSLGNAQLKKALRRAKEEILKVDNYPIEDQSHYYGRGVALAVHGNGVAPFMPDLTTMTLSIYEDASVVLSTSLCDHGGGSNRLLKKIIGEILGISQSSITLVTTDTHKAPYDYIAGASRNTWVGGSCAIKIAEEMKAEVLACAADLLKCPIETITLKEMMFLSSKGEKVSFQEVLKHGYFKLKKKFSKTTTYSSETNAGSYGVHSVILKIAKATGKVTLLDYIAVCDVGRALNPMLLEGQVEGGIQMGIGMALSEQITYDDQGCVNEVNFKKYKMPKAMDMPLNMKVFFIEEGEEKGPFGAKSIGEAAVNPVAPAIANAISNGLGKGFQQLPITNKMVMEVIENEEE